MKHGFKFYLQDETFIKKLKAKKVFIIKQENYLEDFTKYHNFLVKKYNIKNPNIDLFFENKRNNTDKYNDTKKFLNWVLKI